jgi:hypothetical protein
VCLLVVFRCVELELLGLDIEIVVFVAKDLSHICSLSVA